MYGNQSKTVLALAAVAMAALAFTGASASADLVATDLNTGGTDTGFSGDWAGSRNRFIIDANDLTYANYFITQSGTTDRVYVGDLNNHVDRQDSRDLETPMSGQIWFTVLVNVPEGTLFAGLSFHSDKISDGANPYSHNLSDLRVVMSPSQLIVDLDGGGLPSGTGSYAADTTHLILGQMNVAAGNDTLNVWVDPDLTTVGGPSGLPAADYTNDTVDFTDDIVRIGVPLGAIDSADAIWLSDTETAFFDVTGVSGSLAGDADGDGDVDAADYIMFKRNFGKPVSVSGEDGDFNDNGTVDWDDLQELIGAFNASGESQTIPEPATLLIMLAAGLPALLKRRKR